MEKAAARLVAIVERPTPPFTCITPTIFAMNAPEVAFFLIAAELLPPWNTLSS
jgi:hypothetical protein